jgi:hypothetical protein
LPPFDPEKFLSDLDSGAFDARLHESIRELTYEELCQVVELTLKRRHKAAANDD